MAHPSSEELLAEGSAVPSPGVTRMVRTCGVEWVRSAWMRSIVEANVPEEVARNGRCWADVLRRWAAERAAVDGVAEPSEVLHAALSSEVLHVAL